MLTANSIDSDWPKITMYLLLGHQMNFFLIFSYCNLNLHARRSIMASTSSSHRAASNSSDPVSLNFLPRYRQIAFDWARTFPFTSKTGNCSYGNSTDKILNCKILFLNYNFSTFQLLTCFPLGPITLFKPEIFILNPGCSKN